MGGDERNYDGSGGIQSQDLRKDCGGCGTEGLRWGVGLGLIGRGIVYHRALDDKVVREEASGKNCGVSCKEANI